MAAITVLCYGDSNTWGYEPGTGRRYAPEQRWTGVLSEQLGPDWRVVEEGLNGRTTVWTDPLAEYRNGKHLLLPCLETHKPIDVVVLFLGTNDLKAKFGATSYDIGRGIAVLLSIVRTSGAGPDGSAPKVLLISPPVIGNLTEFAEMFTGAAQKSRGLSAQYRSVAAEFGCEFLDAGEVVRSSDVDGIHLNAEEHRQLGVAVALRLKAE